MGKIKLLLIIIFMAFSQSSFAVDRMEGGYVGSGGQIAQDAVWSFIHHFNYEQYYLSKDFEFTSYNNHRVDAMDFAFYCGHGNQWYITMSDNAGVNLGSVGTTADKGWGDNNCEFIGFESCDVIPSPLEVTDWWTNWVGSGGPFDGLHQAVGYRTVAYMATCKQICDYFGGCVHGGYAIWQSWFDAINHESSLDERGCCVMDPNCQMDTHQTFAPDPSPNSQNLTVWWQY